MFNQPSWLSQCAIKNAIYLYKSNKAKGLKTVIFGGFKNLKDYLLKNKTKEQYKLDKLVPITLLQVLKLHVEHAINLKKDISIQQFNLTI